MTDSRDSTYNKSTWEVKFAARAAGSSRLKISMVYQLAMANLAQRKAAEKRIVEPPISKGYTKYISQEPVLVQKRVCEIPGPAGIQIGLSTTVTGRLKGWVTSSGESLAHWAHRDPAHAMITGGEY
ncbi:hypothetical protein AnigIFM60653_010230 [Aspergillus niger]|nr:hypothetical protein AnigIFM60653_010230 [Aspergillus niger]